MTKSGILTEEQMNKLAPPMAQAPIMPTQTNTTKRNGKLPTPTELMARHPDKLVRAKEDVTTDEIKDGWRRTALKFCPFNSEQHTKGSVNIFENIETGEGGFKCFHASDKDKTYIDVVKLLEPELFQTTTEELKKILLNSEDIEFEVAAKIDDVEIKNPLPDNHFITKYMQLGAGLTDSYSEYHMLTGLSLLSIIARRRIFVAIMPCGYYTNLWICILGNSTISRKSTAINIGMNILEAAKLNHYKLPEDFSPEALVEALSQDSQRAFVRDEVGTFIAAMQKQYNSGIEGFLCDIYGCRPKYTRKLRKETFTITDVYMPQLTATTPSTFAECSNPQTLTSGYFARFIYAFPERKRKLMPIGNIGKGQIKAKKELAEWLAKLDKFLEKEKLITYILSTGGLSELNKWIGDFENTVQDSEDPEVTGAIYGRGQEFVIKVAALIELGKEEFLSQLSHMSHTTPQSQVSQGDKSSSVTACDTVTNVTDETDLTQFQYVISENTIKTSIELITGFLNHTRKVLALVQNAKGTELMEKIYTILLKKGTLQHRELLRFSHALKKDFKEGIETLVENGRVKNEEKNGRTYYTALNCDKKQTKKQDNSTLEEKKLKEECVNNALAQSDIPQPAMPELTPEQILSATKKILSYLDIDEMNVSTLFQRANDGLNIYHFNLLLSNLEASGKVIKQGDVYSLQKLSR